MYYEDSKYYWAYKKEEDELTIIEFQTEGDIYTLCNNMALIKSVVEHEYELGPIIEMPKEFISNMKEKYPSCE